MRHNDIKNKSIKLRPQHMEGIFNVFKDNDLLDDSYFYNLLRNVNFPDDLDPTIWEEYVVAPQDTWPLIAWRIYSDVKLWWVICAVNNIQDPTSLPEIGTSIKVLRSSTVSEVLAELRNV